MDDEPNLFERLGGRENLQSIVFQLYDLMRVDSLLGPQFDRFAKTDATFHRLKVRTVDWLEWMIGGPTNYDGPDLYVAHASMHIDEMSYSQMMNLYQQVLAEMDTIDDLTKEELLSVLEAQRAPIVDPLKEFQKDFEERMEKLRQEREIRKKNFQKQKAEAAQALAAKAAKAKALAKDLAKKKPLKKSDAGPKEATGTEKVTQKVTEEVFLDLVPADEAPMSLPLPHPIVLLCPQKAVRQAISV